MMKRSISWLLLFCLLITTLSLGSFAAETYVYDFNEAAGAMWSSTSVRALNRSYTVSIDGGEAQTFSMWILSSDMGKPLRVYSPEMELDTSACTSAELSMECWRIEGNDPELAIQVFYSTDKGTTWAGTLPVTVTKTDKTGDAGGTNQGPVYTMTTGNICDVVKDKIITNLKIVPFEGQPTGGAFRITQLQIATTGSKVTMLSEATLNKEADTDVVTSPSDEPTETGSLYDFNEATGAMWSSTSARAMNRSYTVSIDGGEAQTFSMWIMSPDMGNPLRVYSPEMELDTSACTSAELSITCWRNEKESGPDPEFDFTLYYSTDNGATWAGTLPVTVTDTGKIAVCNQDTTVNGTVYTVTTGNICDQVKDAVITNLKIVPFEGVNTTGAFRITDLTIQTTGAKVTMKQPVTIDINADKEPVEVYVPEINDSPTIQKMIDDTPAGGEVTIGVNPRTGDSNWEIGQPISLPSDITVYIDNATLRLADDVFCNIFYSETAYAETLTAEQEQKNIKIVGKGNAVLDGGNHNGKTESTAGYPDIVQNTFIFFRNVDGFEVKNLTMKNSRWWANTYIFCENGTIENITFDARNTAPNQDGIDLRIGCNNININNISGVTGDDTVALTALLHKFDTRWLVEGKDTNIHHINITNIRALCSGGHGVIRLLAQDGNKVQDITIDTVYDMSIDEGGPRCGQGLIRIGESGYSTVKQNEPGDIDRVTVSNVTSRANSAVYVGTENITWEHLTIRNIKAVEGSIVGGKISLADMPVVEDDTAYGDINEDSEVDAKDALLALQHAVDKIQLDESGIKRADVNGDSQVNAVDALQILQYAVDKIDTFPVKEQI